MSEIMTGVSSRKRKTAGVKRMKRQSLRIDLTPMVDLGFLLITFFIFTTSMSEAKVKEIVMPDDNHKIDMPVAQSGVLTIIPFSSSLVYYYEGEPDKIGANFHKSTMDEIRRVIINKKRFTPQEKMFVIIKPAIVSTYKEVVDILDEMVINDIKRYALTEITSEEESMVK